MNNLNSILLEGNLVRDPEIANTKSDISFCRFSLATNRYYKQNNKYEQEVSYFDVKCWGKLAEVCNEYLKKGRGVRIIGRIKQDRWKSDDGTNHSKVIVMADHIEFKPQFNNKTDTKGDNQGEGRNNSQNAGNSYAEKKESVLV